VSYETIRYDVNDSILTVVLNRPAVLNAFTTLMADELEDAFRRASADNEVRAVVVTGAGSAFCTCDQPLESVPLQFTAAGAS
jgi:enoyl-CoA hydratase/carnithine racemase